MEIDSDKDYVGGKPRMKGHRLWIGHVVSGVEILGVDGYIFDYSLGIDGREKVREALDYCRNEECIENVVRYCQDCRKREDRGIEFWKIAEKIYEREFEV
jgi:uncharacterized protein (DUF433 family)